MRRTILIVTLLALAACQQAPNNKPKRVYPDAQSAAFAVYMRSCSECHAPPLPKVHLATEWPGVIARMQMHIVERSMAPITAADEKVIRDYLVSHAPGG